MVASWTAAPNYETHQALKTFSNITKTSKRCWASSRMYPITTLPQFFSLKGRHTYTQWYIEETISHPNTPSQRPTYITPKDSGIVPLEIMIFKKRWVTHYSYFPGPSITFVRNRSLRYTIHPWLYFLFLFILLHVMEFMRLQWPKILMLIWKMDLNVAYLQVHAH